MLFVNNIAKVVHNMTDRFNGAANKNIGDAFLLVWKYPEIVHSLFEEMDDKSSNPSQESESSTRNKAIITLIADFSCLAFLKIFAKINRNPSILEYRENPKLIDKFHDYKVRMGFGLHHGWSIEGAIGSEYKIDASYLSPNVNMSSRLEGATKQYGVPLLISGELHKWFSESLQVNLLLLNIILFYFFFKFLYKFLHNLFIFYKFFIFLCKNFYFF